LIDNKGANGLVETAVTALLPLVAFYFIFRLLIGGGAPHGRRSSGRRYGFVSPTRMLRTSAGPYPYSPRPAYALWSAYALAMVLATELVNNSESIFSGVATNPVGHPTARAVVTLIVVIACGLAAIMALPRGIGNRALDYVAASLAVVVVLVDPWLGSLIQLAVVTALLRLGGVPGAVLRWAGVLLSYYLVSIHLGQGLVVLSIVMTVLMGTLTMLLIVMTRTVGFAVAFGVLLVIAVTSGLVAPIG
jgi:hypothetical protein